VEYLKEKGIPVPQNAELFLMEGVHSSLKTKST
jgi:hypothetical protein